MDINDILALVKAGYSKDEIAVFTANSNESATITDAPQNDAAEASAAAEEQPAQQAQQAQQSQNAGDAPSWDSVMQSIKALTEAVQANNRQKAQMPAEQAENVYDTLREVSGIKNKK